ncbi:hypothetical protein JTB14_007897, partial [Gonioctena quinquepunctata]
ISLTGKERKNSTEEEIIFAKLKESQNEENPVEATLEMENFKKSCDSSDDLLFQNNAKSASTMALSSIVDEDDLKIHKDEHIQTTNSLIFTKDADTQAELPPLNAPKIEEKKRNKNKCTQTTVLKCDRECETNEAENNQEYVLIDCPVFVLKSSLGTFEKLVIAKFQDSSEKIEVAKSDTPVNDKHEDKSSSDERIFQNNATPLNLFDFATKSDADPTDYFCRRQLDYSRLLTSDYDLTPERDSSTTDKYHHLLVDASTSCANVGGTSGSTGIMQKNLLLTNKYSVISEEASQEDEQPPPNLDLYYLRHSESSQGNECEIRSYMTPSQINRIVSSSSYCLNTSAESKSVSGGSSNKLGVSLDNYEIGRQSVVFEGEGRTSSSLSLNSSIRSTNEFCIGKSFQTESNPKITKPFQRGV